MMSNDVPTAISKLVDAHIELIDVKRNGEVLSVHQQAGIEVAERQLNTALEKWLTDRVEQIIEERLARGGVQNLQTG